MGLTCPLAGAILQVPAIKIWLTFNALINAVLSPHVGTTAFTQLSAKLAALQAYRLGSSPYF